MALTTARAPLSGTHQAPGCRTPPGTGKGGEQGSGGNGSPQEVVRTGDLSLATCYHKTITLCHSIQTRPRVSEQYFECPRHKII